MRAARGPSRRGAGPRRRAQRPQRPPRRRRCARPATRWSRSRRRSTGWPSRRAATASSSRRSRTAPSTSSPAAASCASPSRPRSTVADLRHGQEVMLNEAMNVVAARGFERAGEVVMLKEILEGGDRALVIGHTDEERVVYLADILREQPLRAGDSLLLETALVLRLRADPEERGRGARPRRGPGHRLHRHRRAGTADRGDPRRRRAAVPARRPVPRAPAAPAEGHPALRPARLRQDADRQGGRQLAGQAGRRSVRGGDDDRPRPTS